jgi:predicted dehydrogenase
MSRLLHEAIPIKPYRVGVIGLGNMGARYLEALHANPNYRLRWVCDKNPVQICSLYRQSGSDRLAGGPF